MTAGYGTRTRWIKKGRVVRVFLGLALCYVAVAVGLATHKELRRLPDYVSIDHRFPVTDGYYHYATTLSAWEGLIASKTTGHRFVDGILMYDYGPPIGVQANPVAMAQFVLSLIPERDAPEVRRVIFAHLDRLLADAVESPGGNLLLFYRFDFPHHAQRAPWVSAMAQGQAASALLWGYRMSGDRRYLDAAARLILAMTEPETGLAAPLSAGVWLKEYPNFRFNVLDGSLAALAGVYDTHRALGEVQATHLQGRVGVLLDQALTGLKGNVHCFANPLTGHLYDDSGDLPDSSYYGANLAWLDYLGRADAALGEAREELRARPMSDVRRVLLGTRLVATRWIRRKGLVWPCVE